MPQPTAHTPKTAAAVPAVALCEVRMDQQMTDVAVAAVADSTSNLSLDRRTLLLGAAGALAAVGLGADPVRAAEYARSVAGRHHRRFDPGLAHPAPTGTSRRPPRSQHALPRSDSSRRWRQARRLDRRNRSRADRTTRSNPLN